MQLEQSYDGGYALQEAQLLQEAIAEYEQSLQSITEALEADPGEKELLELKRQLASALQDAEAALSGLQPQPQPDRAAEPAAAALAGGGADAAPPAAAAAAAAASAAMALPRSSVPSSGRNNNNARIHPRSKYAFEAPDFAALGQCYPSLRPFLLRSAAPAAANAALCSTISGHASASTSSAFPGPGGRASLDFTDPAACRELTRVLLRHDFGLEWWVPAGQLVPPVTNRANYIHWLEDLLSLAAPAGPVVGLDIGCGANLIYPLLGAALCGWRFVGVDATPEALRWAARNLGANPQLAALIELRGVDMQPEQQQFHAAAASTAAAAAAPSGQEQRQDGQQRQQQRQQGGQLPEAVGHASSDARPAVAAAAAAAGEAEGAAPAAISTAPPAPVVRLTSGEAAGAGIISGAVRLGECFAFCMCNPPFFESLEEAGRNPATAFGGTAAEMVYPGGELAFVTAMVKDSLTLRGSVHWFTTMVGKKGTLKAVRSLLYRHGVRVLRTTEFFQGRTSRWGLAWSWAADAAAASQPLPRFPCAAAAAGPAAGAAGGSAQQPAAAGQRQQRLQAAAQRPVGRKLSWQVQAPPGAAAPLLDALQHCLRRAGVQCSLNRGAYSIRGSYQPSPEELAAAAVVAEGGEGGGRGPPAAKRPRAQPGPSSGEQPWQLELQLFQQHAGLFLLTAALHRAAPDGALGWFGTQMQRLQAAVAAQWRVLS